MSHGRTYDLTR